MSIHVACTVCGRPVDTREVADGGGPDGAELDDGRWVCSSACWDIAVPLPAAATPLRGSGR